MLAAGADLQNFTRWSQSEPPKVIARQVGSWMKHCNERIESGGGLINKYLRDGFLAYWKAKRDCTATVAATITALALPQEGSTLRSRFALHHGAVYLGGAPSMGEESLLGPAVNFAFRLEDVAAAEGISVCLSADANALVSGHLPTQEVPVDFELKGFSSRHRVFRLAGGTP